MNFYLFFNDTVRVYVKPFNELFHDKFKFHLNKELETLFQQIQTSFAKDVTLTLVKTNRRFFFG